VLEAYHLQESAYSNHSELGLGQGCRSQMIIIQPERCGTSIESIICRQLERRELDSALGSPLDLGSPQKHVGRITCRQPARVSFHPATVCQL